MISNTLARATGNAVTVSGAPSYFAAGPIDCFICMVRLMFWVCP
jgi:hypothetical protein